ncbi:hypothetical protein J6590_062089 [Homalodisca vitripennis]|nr:hypothetical protein J6590_062089 [Homalodisca vitripennis]
MHKGISHPQRHFDRCGSCCKRRCALAVLNEKTSASIDPHQCLLQSEADSALIAYSLSPAKHLTQGHLTSGPTSAYSHIPFLMRSGSIISPSLFQFPVHVSNLRYSTCSLLTIELDATRICVK